MARLILPMGRTSFMHEFAHQLDFENEAADGVPGLATREQQLAWTEVMRSEFASLRAADETRDSDAARHLRSH